MLKHLQTNLFIFLGSAVLSTNSVAADEGDAEITKQLNNPLTSLVILPFQANVDFNLGPESKGIQFKLNFQPVFPINVSKDFNIIVRTIVPVVSQKDVLGPALDPITGRPRIDRYQDGLGDVAQSFFLSPKGPGPGGIIYGIGPVFLYPTATDDLLGSEKWGAGPTLVMLKQTNNLTFGILLNQVWSFAGNSDRNYVSSSTVQPFINYQTQKQTTFGFNIESAYDWREKQWIVPLNFSVSQLVRVGKLPISLQVGARYYTAGPRGSADWGLRGALTVVFPVKNQK